ncbi:MAG: hypothetical protein IT343_02530 [Candidatus Melainabacteria bacterium]|jgi:hypothetical protein|nr:hypothetical protein [Candidatus Melainabacteria bacterium]
MSKRTNPILVCVELPIMAALQAIAKETIDTNGGEAENEGELFDVFSDIYLENLSEAGYSETRPNDRLAIRTFARLIRVKPEDLAALKGILGYNGSVYRDFAVCDTLINALSRSEQAAPALRLLAPADDAKSAGPFYPNKSDFDVDAALKFDTNYVAHVEGIVGKDASVDASAVYLAGALKLTGLSQVAKEFQSAGFAGEDLKAAVAHAALYAIGKDARFVAALRCAQPTAAIG